MFGLFKKKPDPALMFSDDNWQVVQGNYDGNPIIVRLNANLRPFVGISDHTLKVGIALPLNNPRPGGLPDKEENEAIGVIEDKIIDTLKARGSAVQALAITMGTFKEFIYYVKPDMDIALVHQYLKDNVQSHDVQCIASIEKEWETYMHWAND